MSHWLTNLFSFSATIGYCFGLIVGAIIGFRGTASLARYAEWLQHREHCLCPTCIAWRNQKYQ